LGTRKLECRIEEDNQNVTKRIVRDKLKLQQVKLNLSTKNIQMDGGMSVIITDDMEARGSLNARIINTSEETSHSKSRYGTDRYSLEKSAGSKSFVLSEKNLVLSIAREKLANPANMENMVKKMTEGGFDPAKIEQMGKQLEAMMGDGKDEDRYPIKIQLQINGDWAGQITTHSFYRETSRAHGTKTSSKSYATKLPMAVPMAVELSGTYTKGKDGETQINATFQKEEQSPRGYKKCPPTTITNYCSINLKRKRIK